MDFEIMGGDSVIQVEMESVLGEGHLRSGLEDGDVNMDGSGEEQLKLTPNLKEDVPVVPEQDQEDPTPILTGAADDLPAQDESPSALATAPAQDPTPVAGGLQIVTRKRSSLTAPPPPAQDPVVGESPPAQAEAAPAKKKKKWIPKPKSTTPAPQPKKGAAPKSKSKKKSASPPSTSGAGLPTLIPETKEEDDDQLPPLKLQLPKLTKIPSQLHLQMQQQNQNQQQTQPPILDLEASAPTLIPLAIVKEEPVDYENEEFAEAEIPSVMVVEEDGGAGAAAAGKPSRKKKSKGRNGNIYIGVFNRIEWMKLQEEYGFQSVNNFGTFVLQTMRKLHGDISFWCNLAKASGVYPELEKYVWRNGFPHAVNQEGDAYTPPEVDLSDEKREEVVSLAKTMWDQRITELRQQAEQQAATTGDGNGSATGEVITIQEDEEEGEEEEPGLENYLENMATGKFPGGAEAGEEAEKQVNSIWNEQKSNAQTLEEYGKLFTLINSIDQGQEQDSAGVVAPTVEEEK